MFVVVPVIFHSKFLIYHAKHVIFVIVFFHIFLFFIKAGDFPINVKVVDMNTEMMGVGKTRAQKFGFPNSCIFCIMKIRLEMGRR